MRKSTRKPRSTEGGMKLTKDKFVEKNVVKIKEFIPTPPQKVLVNKIRGNTLVFCDAPAGSGKSSTVLWHFCKEYLADHTKEIVVVRTPVEFCDDKIGFLPNSLEAKLEVHFESSRKILEEFLGKGRLEADLGTRIHFKIPNYMLGSTLNDTMLLVDEVQQLSPQILKLILERIGKNCKVVIAGSSEQLFDAKGKRNGLEDAIGRFFDFNEDDEAIPRFNDMAFHEFDVNDVMRAEIVKDVIRAYRGE